MSTNRLEKINSLLEHEISKIILRDFDFSPSTLVTLTHVDTTTNLIEARVYISVFPDDKADYIMGILKRGVYDVQYKINRTLRQRPIPKIIFMKDKQTSKAGKVEELLAKHKEDELSAQGGPA